MGAHDFGEQERAEEPGRAGQQDLLRVTAGRFGAQGHGDRRIQLRLRCEINLAGDRAGTVEHHGQGRHGAGREHLPHGQLDVHGGADPAGELGGQQ